jgi:hypothetical protein
VQVSPRPGLLARCGERASSCCRHVDNSTAVHRVAVPSTLSPWSTHGRSPGPVGGDGARPVLRTSFRRVVRRPRRSAARSASDRLPTATREQPAVSVTSRDLARTRPSPVCAHSWGQLLDESTRNGLVNVPPRGSPEVSGLSTGLPPVVDESTPRTRRVSSAVRTRGDEVRRRLGGSRRHPARQNDDFPEHVGAGKPSAAYWRARLLMRAVSSVTCV